MRDTGKEGQRHRDGDTGIGTEGHGDVGTQDHKERGTGQGQDMGMGARGQVTHLPFVA